MIIKKNKTRMIIKKNKTRISFWLMDLGRYSKIELNKIVITYGYNRNNNQLWDVYNFNTIDNGISILQTCLINKNINLSLIDIQKIKIYYNNLV